MISKTKFFAQMIDYRNAVEIMGIDSQDDKGATVWTSVTVATTFVPSGEIAYASPAPLTLDRRAAQSLLDALIDCGMRPTNRDPLEPTIAAMQEHIDFIQTVCVSLLGRSHD
jgi:hypothetical protein